MMVQMFYIPMVYPSAFSLEDSGDMIYHLPAHEEGTIPIGEFVFDGAVWRSLNGNWEIQEKNWHGIQNS